MPIGLSGGCDAPGVVHVVRRCPAAAAPVEPIEPELSFGYLLNELPFIAFYWLLASTLLAAGQGDLDTPGGWVAFGLAVLTTVGLVVVAWRGLRARPGRSITL